MNWHDLSGSPNNNFRSGGHKRREFSRSLIGGAQLLFGVDYANAIKRIVIPLPGSLRLQIGINRLDFEHSLLPIFRYQIENYLVPLEIDVI